MSDPNVGIWTFSVVVGMVLTAGVHQVLVLCDWHAWAAFIPAVGMGVGIMVAMLNVAGVL